MGFFFDSPEEKAQKAAKKMALDNFPIYFTAPKLQLEVAHFLKIKLRKSYRVRSRIDHQVFCSLEFS